MQLSNCTLRLGGELTTTVQKINVTPAEILVLRHEHGSDAVVDVVPFVNIKRRSADELERLRGFYRPQLVDELFPGASPILPQTVADVDIEFDGEVPDGSDPTEVVDPDEADLDVLTRPQTAAGTGVTTSARA